MIKSCPGAGSIKEIRPFYVQCPHCKTEVEVWSDEFRARCPTCQAWVYAKQGVTCLDWCAQAEACVGAGTLAAYRKAREREDTPEREDS